MVKNLFEMQQTQEMRFPSLSQEDPLKKEMATHSGILIGKIPWTEEPCGLEAVELQELDTTEKCSLGHTNNTNKNDKEGRTEVWDVMDTFTTLTVVMLSGVYTYPQTY